MARRPRAKSLRPRQLLQASPPEPQPTSEPLRFGPQHDGVRAFDLAARDSRRMAAKDTAGIGTALGVKLRGQRLHLIPLTSDDSHVATLALIEPARPGSDDTLMQAYASRAAAAYAHAVRDSGH